MHDLGYAWQLNGDLREERDWAWSIVRPLRCELLEERELAERRLRKVERLRQQREDSEAEAAAAQQQLQQRLNKAEAEAATRLQQLQQRLDEAETENAARLQQLQQRLDEAETENAARLQQLQQLQLQLHASERANKEVKADQAAALKLANTSADKAADACVRAKAAEALVKEADASEKKAVASAHAQGVREGMQRAAAGSFFLTAGGLAPVGQFRPALPGPQEKRAARATFASTAAAADLENRAPHGPL